jgi:hypothetical protein
MISGGRTTCTGDRSTATEADADVRDGTCMAGVVVVAGRVASRERVVRIGLGVEDRGLVAAHLGAFVEAPAFDGGSFAPLRGANDDSWVAIADRARHARVSGPAILGAGVLREKERQSTRSMSPRNMIRSPIDGLPPPERAGRTGGTVAVFVEDDVLRVGVPAQRAEAGRASRTPTGRSHVRAEHPARSWARAANTAMICADTTMIRGDTAMGSADHRDDPRGHGDG